MAAKDLDADQPKMLTQFEAMGNIIQLQKVMDKAAQDQGMYFTSLSGEVMRRGAISTGSLSFDLFMGGGHQPGRFTYFYGPTGSGKSTILYQSIVDPLQRDLPVNFLDYEASTDPDYLVKLGIDVERVLGNRNKKGEWIVEPRLRYTQPNTVQEGFGYLRNLLRALPDKVMLADDGEPRFFVISPEYKYQLTWRSINEGLKTKKVYEVADGSPQMVVMVDSFNAMTPDAAEDRYDDKGQDIALLAKALGAGLQLTKSLLGKKMVNLIGVNALKLNPMARMQNPETEPGGTAMQFYPDVKIKLIPQRAFSALIEEPNISGEGIDRYMQGTATIIKNKGGSAWRKMPYRIWVDELGVPKGGIDPVFDVYTFLTETSQLEVAKDGGVKILVPGFESGEFISMRKFKEFVLSDPDYTRMRAALTETLRSGTALEMYYDTIKDRSTKDKVKTMSGKGMGVPVKTDEDDGDDEGGDNTVDL